ncbi:MAG: YkgJ family cysteine cluster protein [Acidimicrobiia bacterium]
MEDPDALDAGDFGAWIDGMQRALRGEQDADVPCGGCTACCTASQFVHIAPDETDTLAHIPGELLFPAPLLPRGQMVLGYDEHGRCPMLGEAGCSIYEHRPRTCRTYDCRVFAAAAVDVDDDRASGIADRVRRWRFRVASSDDRVRRGAVEAAAARLAGAEQELGDGAVPSSPTQLAVLAVEVHDHFLRSVPETGGLEGAVPPASELADAVDGWSPGRA